MQQLYVEINEFSYCSQPGMQQNPGIGGGAPMLPPKPGMGGPNMNMNADQPINTPMNGAPNARMGINPNGANPSND